MSDFKEYKYFYSWKKYKPERFGDRCMVLARGRGPGPLNMLIEFLDGTRMVTPRYSVRRVKEGRKRK